MGNEFYDKARDYALGRPSYPSEILVEFRKWGIGENSLVVDIGAGTGLLTRLLGEMGCTVLALEPSEEMLDQCRCYCEAVEKIEFVCACAENTTLGEHSVDLITIAQAFHP